MTKEEILELREKNIFMTQDECDSEIFNNHYNRWEFFNTVTPSVTGQYFLYEAFFDLRLQSSQNKFAVKITYPKLGVYVNSLPCDQTIEVEWIDYRRTWESNIKYDYEYDGKNYSKFFSNDSTEINSMPLWVDSLLVYGVWNSRPNWKQLRACYEKTWWFWRSKDQLRDIRLNRLLNI